jgi:hypothetical protein
VRVPKTEGFSGRRIAIEGGAEGGEGASRIEAGGSKSLGGKQPQQQQQSGGLGKEEKQQEQRRGA